MTALLNQRQRTWLLEKGGQRIDALDAALAAFAPRDLQTLIVLRRQIQTILSETRECELASIAAAAERADRAGALDVRGCAAMLLALLRGTAQACRTHPSPPDRERDHETGLLNAFGFMRRLDAMEDESRTQLALAAIHVADFEVLRERHGAEAAHLLLTHVGGLLERSVREDDHVAHMRGGEFAVFLPDEDTEGLQIVLSRIEMTVQRHPFRLPDGTVAPVRIVVSGCSLGGARAESPAAATANGARPCVALVTLGVGSEKAMSQALTLAGFTVLCARHEGSHRLASLEHHKIHLVVLEDSPAGLPGDAGGAANDAGPQTYARVGGRE